MKRLLPFLLLVALLYGNACTTPQPLLKKSPYDASFRFHAEKLEGKQRKVKHIKKMETAFQLAQKADLIAADSMINLEDKPDRWLYVNAYHRRMQDRQRQVLALLPLESKDGYKPDVLIVSNLDERESASRKSSAQYLYGLSVALLATNNIADAREAYHTLVNLQENYYPQWENAEELLDSAATSGVEHVLLEPFVDYPMRNLDSKWQKFYRDPRAREHFDIIIRSAGPTVYVGPDEENTSSYTESKEIEVGYEEKKDSAGNVIQRTPLYETITATVTEVEVSKTAEASVWVDIFDGWTGALMSSEMLSTQHRFCDKSVRVSGDTRALSTSVPATAFSIFTPTYWWMENKVVDQLKSDFAGYIKSRLWTD